MILRHRDRELLRFEWNGLEGVRIVSVNEAEKQFLPLEMRGEATDERLWDWLRHRILPKHRQYVHYALEKLGIEYNVRSIITVSKGLSLNDVTDRHLGNFGYLVDNDPMISRQELSDILHIPLRTIARRIKTLVDNGEVVREGGRKMGYWRVLK